jgi:hypothetical protein
MHKTVFSLSKLTIDEVDVRFLSPDIAVAHVIWSMQGALSPSGTVSDIPQHGIQSQVLQKRSTGWLIASFQNTNIARPAVQPTAVP